MKSSNFYCSLFIVFLYSIFLSPSFLTFAANEFTINSVSINTNNEIEVNISSNLPEITANFKIGVACENDYGLGYIYNPELDKYLSYSFGKWEETPKHTLLLNNSVILKGKVFDSTRCPEAYLKIRARSVPGLKFIEVLHTDKIILTQAIVTTPTTAPSILPTIPIVTVLPTSIPTPNTVPHTIETSTDKELVLPEQAILSSKEKGNILITEFMPNPDGETEWVEIFNNNERGVTLTNWSIDDVLSGGGTPFLFTTEIKEESFAVIEINKSLLNNSNDEVNLLDENKNLIHSVSYKKTVKGSSIQKNLYDKKWYITIDVTKGNDNINMSTLTPSIAPKVEESNNLDLTTHPNPISVVNTEPLDNLSTFNSNVLGIYSELIATNSTYDTVKTYKSPSQFIVNEESVNKAYIITEKQIKHPFQIIFEFIERAFW